MKAVLMALLMAMTVLAGCADDGNGGDNGVVEGKVDDADKEDALSEGKGAIEGLLVDDAFRPLELVDDPQSQYQFKGFLFIQELALQVQTNENGEFTILDVEPGTYRLRPQVQGHDGSTQRITVTAGVFTEVTVTLQRQASDTSTILTEEYTGFTPCAITGLVFNCLDASADSWRPGPEGLDYTLIENITYVIIEMRVNRPGDFFYQLQSGNSGNVYTNGGNYAKGIFYNPDYVTEPIPGALPWNNVAGWDCIFFINGAGTEFATKSQFMISLFINDPTLDLETYALIADDQAT